MRVAIYARYSTDKQERVSIAVQNDNARAFIAKKGWTEVGAYADEAISGAVIALRPGMKALLASVERGEVDLVLADEVDRLSRSQSQMPMIFERFQFLGGNCAPSRKATSPSFTSASTVCRGSAMPYATNAMPNSARWPRASSASKAPSSRAWTHRCSQPSST